MVALCVKGEWTRFSADGLLTKDPSAVTTGAGSTFLTFTQHAFTGSLMQTQPLLSLCLWMLLLQNRDVSLLYLRDYRFVSAIFGGFFSSLCIRLKDVVSRLDVSLTKTP